MSIFNNPQGDKRTLLAVLLSVIVITVGFTIQGLLFPPAQPSAAPAPAASAPQAGVPAGAAVQAPAPETRTTGQISVVAVGSPASGTISSSVAVEAPSSERTYTISTDLVEAVFTNKGGDLVALKLKKHRDKSGAVDLIVPGTQGTRGLSVAFGGPAAAPIKELMNAHQDDRSIEFSRSYNALVPGKSEPVQFTYKKTYSFRDGEYLFNLSISLENSANDYLALDQNGIAYSILLGPQIGPKLDAGGLKQNADFRKFITFTDGKKREERPKAGVPSELKYQPKWVAIAGKYFAFIAIPSLTNFGATLATSPDPVLVQTDFLSISRPVIKASKQIDGYYFYFGPKTSAELKKYEFATDNAFAREGFKLEDVMETSNILGWLESILKYFMNVFYKLIPNFGIAIILVTILVKVVLFPLTKKGSESSARMQELQPKMQELQAKYKSNPQKLNEEMAKFYKAEGYNPLSGCLPLLIQFPLFIAMYNLFNNHFDLRGAMFIPGWIPDLSQPEAILSFPTVNLFVAQIDALRVLPIIYLLSQLFYGKFTQMATPGQSATQMKIMMYGMPIFFFFILYNTPSGLLIYWIATNLLSIVQQIAINDILKKRRAAAAASAPANKIAPGKKK